jgi:hypothetical protein
MAHVPIWGRTSVRTVWLPIFFCREFARGCFFAVFSSFFSFILPYSRYMKNERRETMKVKNLIRNLKKLNPEAEVVLHNWLEERFSEAEEVQEDELDFFMELLESGVTLEHIRVYAPKRYEYVKQFCEEHGLV